MMTKDFDPISEFPCHSEEFGEGIINTFIKIQSMHLLTEWESRMVKYLAGDHGVQTE